MLNLALATTLFAAPTADWLIDAAPFEARVVESEDGRSLSLENGLVRRTWRLAPNLACVALDELTRDRSLLRAVRPAARLVLDGEAVDVGGLVGQPNHAYLRDDWLDGMTADPAALRFVGHVVDEPVERFAWKRTRHHAPDAAWPPPGARVRFDFEAGPDRGALAHARVSVFVELYDGLPCFSKWLTVTNAHGERVLEVDRVTSELLAIVEEQNWVESRDGVVIPRPSSLPARGTCTSRPTTPSAGSRSRTPRGTPSTGDRTPTSTPR